MPPNVLEITFCEQRQHSKERGKARVAFGKNILMPFVMLCLSHKKESLKFENDREGRMHFGDGEQGEEAGIGRHLDGRAKWKAPRSQSKLCQLI